MILKQHAYCLCGPMPLRKDPCAGSLDLQYIQQHRIAMTKQ